MEQFLFRILLALITVVNSKAREDALKASSLRHDVKKRSVVNIRDLGTFDTGYPFDYPPIERFYNSEPHERKDIATMFRFFSPVNKEVPQIFSNMNFSTWDVKKSGFTNQSKTYFLIHDYLGRNAEWLLRLKNALLTRTECNVFVVEWGFEGSHWYDEAVADIRIVGAEVGLYIQRFMNTSNLNLDLVHIIGHGLGAQASGYAGKWIRESRNISIGRITGLDPAGPFFNGVSEAVRLDKSDASFVDVIHTNVDGKHLEGYGLKEPIGHADFYPNGGESQPGCGTASSYAVDTNQYDILSYTSGLAFLQRYSQRKPQITQEEHRKLYCSHTKACEYFIASVEEPNCKFESSPCYSWDAYEIGGCGSCFTTACVRMGLYAAVDRCEFENEIPLKLYLKTDDSSPFCDFYPSVQHTLIDSEKILKTFYN
ncbi:pancreatic triacylglycerol lipase-like [Stegodyphus dumicola]|uniref:pancreatic triacylglycerol lipase-like n=1 Tax=Stegodyphus dumicola TaxID=202533 RepID=UPI0015AAFB57|nr:pancreatic triacylglycerol lipase-like [Stegodyphus dumicola]